MNQNEQTRLKVLNSVMVGQLPVAQAAGLLGVSERHVWRVLAAYRREGAAALVHGNRGRRPANATSEAAIAYVLRLATTRYSGTNHTHLSELLMEREGIALSRSTVRRIALSAGVRSPRRRRSPRHRVRRRRMPQAGMLVQIDGSHHRWLEERGPSFALLLAVDDATSTAPYALFQPEEDARGYLMLMEGLIPAPRYTAGRLQRPSRRFQASRRASAEAAGTDAVCPCDAAVGHTTDIRAIATSQGACRADRGDVPGSTRH